MTETGAGQPGGPAGAADSQDVPGLDLAALGAYVAAANPGIISGPLRASCSRAGRSNLTYEVSDGTGAGWCAARRSATCSPPRTTWPASTG